MAYDPFSESTNRTKRNLLAVSFIGLLLTTGKIGVKGGVIPLLGFAIEPAFVPTVFTVIVVYLLFFLALRLVDDRANVAKGHFQENIENERNGINTALQKVIGETLAENFNSYSLVLRDPDHAAEQVAMVIIKETASDLSKLDEEIHLAARSVLDPYFKGGDNHEVVLYEDFLKEKFPAVVKALATGVRGGLAPIAKKSDQYKYYRKFRFWAEGLTPVIVAVIALGFVWYKGAVLQDLTVKQENLDTSIEVVVNQTPASQPKDP